MISLILDPGHGGRECGAIGINGLQEKDCTLYICKKCKKILEDEGISITLTRTKDIYLSMEDRIQLANEEGGDYFISIHFNSSSNLTTSGTEIYYVDSDDGENILATKMLDVITKEMKFLSRGIKTGDSQVIKHIDMPSILIEVCFLSNPKEEALLEEDSFKDKIAESIAKGFLKFIGKFEDEKKIESTSEVLTPILQKSNETAEQAKQWAKNKGATDTFISLADIYWRLAKEHGRVNPTVAYAQAALDTNYGEFNDDINEEYKNPCKLKTLTYDDKDNKEIYSKFSTWTEGVGAHLDHLALYAGADGYPRDKSKDSTHIPSLFGLCKYVEDLSGRWSVSQTYSVNIVQLIFEISDTVVKDDLSNIKVIKENNDSSIDNNSDNGKELSAELIKRKIVKINDSLNDLKNQYNKILDDLQELQRYIDNLNKKNKHLTEENKNLTKEIYNYKKGTMEIIHLIQALD